MPRYSNTRSRFCVPASHLMLKYLITFLQMSSSELTKRPNPIRSAKCGECVRLISQTAEIKRRLAFGGRFAKKSLQLRPRPRIAQELLPALVILLGQKKPSKIGNLCPFILWQCFANADQILRFAAHLSDLRFNWRLVQTVEQQFQQIFDVSLLRANTVMFAPDHSWRVSEAFTR
jgi:hypothetical protein